MTTSTQSKAQRRAESQRKAAERRAAELRAKRVRTTVRYGGVLVVVLVVVLVIVLLAGSITEHACRQVGRRRQDRADPVVPADGR